MGLQLGPKMSTKVSYFNDFRSGKVEVAIKTKLPFLAVSGSENDANYVSSLTKSDCAGLA